MLVNSSVSWARVRAVGRRQWVVGGQWVAGGESREEVSRGRYGREVR